jgi:hypothetical protein
MKKIILFLGFSILGLFAFSQELTFDSLYYEPQIIDDTTTNYFVVHIKKYDNGNEITEKQFIGNETIHGKRKGNFKEALQGAEILDSNGNFKVRNTGVAW